MLTEKRLDEIEASAKLAGYQAAIDLCQEIRRLRAALADARDALENYADADFDGERYVTNRAGSAINDINIALGEV